MVNVEAKAATYARNVFNHVPGYTIEKAKRFFASNYQVFEWWYNHYAEQRKRVASLAQIGLEAGTIIIDTQSRELVSRVIMSFENKQAAAFGRISKDYYNIRYGIKMIPYRGHNAGTAEVHYELKGRRFPEWLHTKGREEELDFKTEGMMKAFIKILAGLQKQRFWNGNTVKQFTVAMNGWLDGMVDLMEERVDEFRGELRNE